MPRKKAVPPAETPETEMVTPAPEAAPETPSTAQPQALEASPVPPASPQAEPSVMPEPEPSALPTVPEEETAASEAAQVPEGLPAIVTASKGLNFRAGPGFGFDVLGVVEFGTLLIVLDLPMGVKVPGWALAWLGETAGWVSDKYLRLLVD